MTTVKERLSRCTWYFQTWMRVYFRRRLRRRWNVQRRRVASLPASSILQYYDNDTDSLETITPTFHFDFDKYLMLRKV